MNSDKDVIASLGELKTHKQYILSLFETEIKQLEHFCWKYRTMEGSNYYKQLSETKKVYNILKYLLDTCNGKENE